MSTSLVEIIAITSMKSRKRMIPWKKMIPKPDQRVRGGSPPWDRTASCWPFFISWSLRSCMHAPGSMGADERARMDPLSSFARHDDEPLCGMRRNGREALDGHSVSVKPALRPGPRNFKLFPELLLESVSGGFDGFSSLLRAHASRRRGLGRLLRICVSR